MFLIDWLRDLFHKLKPTKRCPHARTQFQFLYTEETGFPSANSDFSKITKACCDCLEPLVPTWIDDMTLQSFAKIRQSATTVNEHTNHE